jgi:hypothetical protein
MIDQNETWEKEIKRMATKKYRAMKEVFDAVEWFKSNLPKSWVPSAAISRGTIFDIMIENPDKYPEFSKGTTQLQLGLITQAMNQNYNLYSQTTKYQWILE